MSEATLTRRGDGTAASRHHLGFLAAMVHRLSGLALALFLPLHFLALGVALDTARFDRLLAWADDPLVKLSEVVLVTALGVHMTGGVRILAVELCGLARGHAFWIALALAGGAGIGLLFALRAFG